MADAIWAMDGFDDYRNRPDNVRGSSYLQTCTTFRVRIELGDTDTESTRVIVSPSRYQKSRPSSIRFPMPGGTLLATCYP